MAVGNPLIGKGVLIVGSGRHDGVRYRIEVHKVGASHLRAVGLAQLPKAAVGAAIEAFNGGQCSLQLATGDVIEIVSTNLTIQGSPASFSFTVSGPVPGYAP